MKLLLADDNADSRLSVEKMLREHGYTVECARNGSDALEKARLSRPDVIVSDVMMPEMDGFMLCRKAGEDERLKHIPIILYSSTFCIDDDKELALSLGAARFIVKPENPDNLLKVILEVFEAGKTRSRPGKAKTQAENTRLEKLHYKALLKKLQIKILELEAARQEITEIGCRYGSLFKNMVEGVACCRMLYDASGAPADWLYLDTNESFKKLTGIKNAAGHKVSELLPALRTENPELLDIFGRVASTGRSEIFDVYLEPLARWFHISAYSPEKNCFVILFEDITGRRAAEAQQARTESQLLQSQKMEVAGRLASGIAHDFNNILTAIFGYADLVLKAMEKDDPLRTAMEEINSAGERAASLTRQLLSFSRNQVLDFKVLDINDVVTDMQGMLKRLISEDIKTTFTPACGPALVKADFGHIQQVILNLAVNARDAMPKGGQIDMQVRVERLDSPCFSVFGTVPSGNYITLLVTDTGCGMADEVKSHIFEPFFTTKAADKGTGLGLSIIFGIIKQSNGYIDVESSPGKGTSFKVYLPQAVPAPDPGGRVAPLSRLFKGAATILLVEDDTQIREVGRRILNEEGFTVLEAGNAGEALEICQNHTGPIHLLLTDMVMPGMSGPELAERLSLRWPDLKVIFMSGHTDHPVINDGVADKGITFIQKPFSLEVLVRVVNEVLCRLK